MFCPCHPEGSSRSRLRTDIVLPTLQSNWNLKKVGGGERQNKNIFFNFNDFAEKAKMGSIGKVCSATCLWHLHINMAIKKLKSILEFPVVFTRSETKEAARLSPTFATEPAFRAK